MEKKGTAMSLRLSEFHSERPKNRQLVNTGGEYISPEFQTYLLNKPYIYRDYVKEIKSPHVVEKSPVVRVSPFVKPYPCSGWCTSTPKVFSQGASNLVSKLIHSDPNCNVKGKRRSDMLTLNKPLTSRAERIRYGIVDKDSMWNKRSVLNVNNQKKNNYGEAKKISFDVVDDTEEDERSQKQNEKQESLTSSLAAVFDEAIKQQKRSMMLEKCKLFLDQSCECNTPKDESDAKEKK